MSNHSAEFSKFDLLLYMIFRLDGINGHQRSNPLLAEEATEAVPVKEVSPLRMILMK